jgi:hypothetical protein
MAPEEARSVLGEVGQAGLSGLAYLGGSIGKLGRAIRGGIGAATGQGTPREILAAIPFSDLLGITNPEQEVTEEQLFEATPFAGEKGSWRNWLGGLAVGIATDPLTYIGGGGLTKAGQLAAKAGPRLRNVAEVAAQGGKTAHSTLAKEAIKQGRLAATRAAQIEAGQAGLLHAGIPFTGKRIAIGTGERSRKIAAWAHEANKQFRSLPGVRHLAGPFSEANTTNAMLQMAHENITRPAIDAAEHLVWNARREAQQAFNALNLDQVDADLVKVMVKVVQEGPESLKVLPAKVQQEYASLVARRPEVQTFLTDHAARRRAISAAQIEDPRLLGKGKAEFGEKTFDSRGKLLGKYVSRIQAADLDEQLAYASMTPAEQNQLRLLFQAKPTINNDLQQGLQSIDVKRQGIIARNPNFTDAAVRKHLSRDFHQLRGTMMAPFHEQKYEYVGRLKTKVPGEFTARALNPLRTAMGSDIKRDPILRFFPQHILNEMSLDPAIAGSAGTMDLAARQKYIANNYLSRFDFPPDKMQKLSRGLAQEMANIPDEAVASGIPMFGNNPFDDELIRDLRTTNQELPAIKTKHSVLADSAVPLGAAAKEPMIPMADALKKVGLDYDVMGPGTQATGPNYVSGARVTAASELTRRYGGQLTGADVDKFMVPKRIVADLEKIRMVAHAGEGTNPLMDFMRKYKSGFDRMVTLPWLAHHVRNLGSGTVTNVVERAYDPTASWAMSYIKPKIQAHKLAQGGVVKNLASEIASAQPGWKGLTDEQAGQRLVEMGFDWGWFRPGEVGVAVKTPSAGNLGQMTMPERLVPGMAGYLQEPELAKAARELVTGKAGAAGARLKAGAAEMLPFKRGAGPAWLKGVGLNPEWFPLKEGEKALNNVEFINRMEMAIPLLKQGFSPEAIAERIRNAHFDYSRIGAGEKSWIRPLTTVGYTYARKNLPYQLRTLYNDPARLSTMLKVGEGLAESPLAQESMEARPEWMTRGFTVPLPSWLSGAPEGRQAFLSQLGLPIEEAFQRFNFGPGGVPDVGRTTAEILGMIHPIPKAAIEYATGRQLYSGRELKDVERQFTRSPLLNELIVASPLARLFSTGRALSNLAQAPIPTAMNVASGVRVSDVDVERTRRALERRMAEAVIRQIPGSREFREVYVPKSIRGKLTPEQMQWLAAVQALNREAMRRAKMAQ